MGEDRQPGDRHFVSSARATLSPVPARKGITHTSPVEDEVKEERELLTLEAGIVETSIKASSVIQQFETRKISKIKPDHEVYVTLDQNGVNGDQEPVPIKDDLNEVDKTKKKKKSVDTAGDNKRRVSGKGDTQIFKATSSANLSNRNLNTRKQSNDQKLIKTTSTVSVTNNSKSRKPSKEVAQTVAKDRKGSKSSTGHKTSESKTVKRSPSNASTVSVGAKSRESTFVKRSSSKQILPDIDGSTTPSQSLDDSAGTQDRSQGKTRTTMLVQLSTKEERERGDEKEENGEYEETEERVDVEKKEEQDSVEELEGDRNIDKGENKEETIQYENNDEDNEDLEIKHEELEMEVVERKLSYEDDVVEVDVIEEEEDEKVLDNIQERNEDHEIEKEDYFEEQNNSSDSDDFGH